MSHKNTFLKRIVFFMLPLYFQCSNSAPLYLLFVFMGLKMWRCHEIPSLLTCNTLSCRWSRAACCFTPEPMNEYTHTPTAQAIGREQRGALFAPIHLILFLKSLYWADQARFSRLVVGCLHRCIRGKKVCWWRTGQLPNINHTEELAAAGEMSS